MFRCEDDLLAWPYNTNLRFHLLKFFHGAKTPRASDASLELLILVPRWDALVLVVAATLSRAAC